MAISDSIVTKQENAVGHQARELYGALCLVAVVGNSASHSNIRTWSLK